MESMGKAIPIPIAHRQVQQQEHHQNKQQLEHVESNNSSLNSYSFPPQPQSQSKRSNSQSIPLNSSNDNDEVEGEREISYSPELIKRSSSSTGSNSTMILKNESDINHNRSNSNNSNSSYGKGGVNISNNRSNEIEPIPTEYSSIGKQIYAGRQNFSFSEFISDSNEDNVPSSLSNNSINSTPVITYGTLPPSSFPNRFNTPALLLRRPSTLLSSNSSSSPYSNFAPPPPPSIHPYQWNGYTTSTHTTTSHLSSTSTSLNSPCCSNPEPHSHFAPPPINPSQLLNPSGYYSSDSRLQFGTTNQNFNRDHQRIISSSSSSYYPQIVYGSTTGNNGLVRSVSSQSSISAQSNNSSQGTGHYSSSDSPTLRQTSTISAYQQYQQQLQQEQQEQQESLSTTNSPIQSRLKQQHNPSTSSTPHQSQTPAHYVYGTKLVNGTASTSDLEDLTELQIYNSSKTSAVTRSGINHSASTRSMTIDSTITPSTNTTTPRTKTKTSTTTPKPKKLSSASKLASGKNIFHPSPNSMLAPNSTLSTKVRGLDSKTGKILPAAFPGTNSPGTPSDAEFAKMMTKRSRGRRPPDSSALGLLNSDPSDGFSPVSGGNNLDGDYGEFGGMSTEGEGEGNSESFDTNLVPTKEQLALFGGYTKTGKVKKVFLCKVPGCGKCFKRSEHLKRHVRSIHTNDKPFQCRWPSCGKLFSRHDNLSQHAAGVNQTDEEFSKQLEECFAKPLGQTNFSQSERIVSPQLQLPKAQEINQLQPQPQQFIPLLQQIPINYNPTNLASTSNSNDTYPSTNLRIRSNTNLRKRKAVVQKDYDSDSDDDFDEDAEGEETVGGEEYQIEELFHARLAQREEMEEDQQYYN